MSLLVFLLFRMISFFVLHSFWIFLIVNFITGTGAPFAYLIPGIMLAELSDDEFRSFSASLTWGVWVSGMAAVPYVAYFCSEWFLLGMVTMVPVLFFLYIPFIDESPRWLVSVGRVAEASRILQKVALVNGTSDKLTVSKLNAALDRIVLQQQQNEKKNTEIWALFSTRNLTATTLLLTTSW